MSITAVTISRAPAPRVVPGLQHLNLPGQVIDSAAAACAAWFDSIALVKTPWFFWLDSDDDLPDDHLDVLADCQRVAGHAPLVYTDELRILPSERQRRVAGAYERAAHARRPTMLHHLVLVRTDAARAALRILPRGHFWPELLLFWQLARDGAPYVPRIGYHWHQGEDGLSRAWFTTYGIAQSQNWCHAHP